MSSQDGIYIRKQYQSLVISVPVNITDNILYRTRAPIYPEELWNDFHRIAVPPTFQIITMVQYQ